MRTLGGGWLLVHVAVLVGALMQSAPGGSGQVSGHVKARIIDPLAETLVPITPADFEQRTAAQQPVIAKLGAAPSCIALLQRVDYAPQEGRIDARYAFGFFDGNGVPIVTIYGSRWGSVWYKGELWTPRIKNRNDVEQCWAQVSAARSGVSENRRAAAEGHPPGYVGRAAPMKTWWWWLAVGFLIVVLAVVRLLNRVRRASS